MKEKIFNKYNKKARLFNIEQLIENKSFKGFHYSTRFLQYDLHCLVNHQLKIVITRSSDTQYVKNELDYLFIKYKNPYQLGDKNFIDRVNKVIERNTWILNRSKELNDNLPKSEVWFYDKFKHTDQFKEMNFRRNQIFRSLYICDLFSLKYRTVIEVDGSYHERPDQIEKDIQKDNNIKRYHFNLIRVKAFDDDSFLNCLNELNKIISKGSTIKIKSNLKKYYNEEDEVYVRRRIKVDKKDFKNRIRQIDLSKKLPF